MVYNIEGRKNENGEVMSISDLEKEHLGIMIAAVQVNLCLYTIQINELMKNYTNDERVLDLALTVEKLYDKDESPRACYENEIIINLKSLLGKLIELEAKCNK